MKNHAKSLLHGSLLNISHKPLSKNKMELFPNFFVSKQNELFVSTAAPRDSSFSKETSPEPPTLEQSGSSLIVHPC
jgi:hypothetical protein